MQASMLIFGIAFTCFVISCALEFEDECSTTKRRKCRTTMYTELDNQKKAFTTHQLEFHCKSLKENLECMVWQLSECSTNDLVADDGDVLWRARKYMKMVCETFGAWWQNRCFTSKEAKLCEKHILAGDIRNKDSTCSDYDLFHDCIVDLMEAKCSDEEADYFGSYLLDRAGSMIWNCPRSDTRHYYVRHTEFDDKQTSDSSHVSVIGKGTSSSISSDKLNNKQLIASGSRIHAFRSASLIGDSPFVTGCNARATEEMRGCLDRHQYERDQALGAKDGDSRLKKSCCATWNYKKCLQNAVRIHCYDTREVDIQAASDVIPHDGHILCTEHWYYQCDGASAAIPSTFSVLIVGIMFMYRLFDMCH